MSEKIVYDPVELVKDLADKIGINQLYAIVCDIRGAGVEDFEKYMRDLEMQNKGLKEDNNYLKESNARMHGEISGLRFAIRCNGVSGSEVSVP